MSLAASLTIPPAATLNRVGSSASERQLVLAGADSVASVIFGEPVVVGRILNILPAAANSSTLIVQVLWGFGTIDAVTDVRLNDAALPAGATITHYLGTQTAADPAMVTAMAAQGITYTAALTGYAYSVLSMPMRGFTGQIKIDAVVRGLRLYDPRLDSTVAGGSGPHRLALPATWTYSRNAVLALARWLWDPTFGCGEPVDWVSVIGGANHSDALIGSPAEPRNRVDIEISRATSAPDVADALRAYAGCWLVPPTSAAPGANGIRIVPDADGPAVASYSHAAGQIYRFGPLTSRDTAGAPTVVEVLYTDQTRRPPRDGRAVAQVAGAGTTRPYRLSQVRLPGITRFSQANRAAIERLNKLQLGDLSAPIEWLDDGIRHEVGDIINVTHPVGVTAKPFRLASPPEMVSRGRWRALVVEHDPAMYSTTVATGPTIPDTLLINPSGPPPDLTGLTATAIQGAVRISWAGKPVVDIECAELRVTPTGGTASSGTRLDTGAAGSMDVDAATYDWSWPAAGGYIIWARWRDRDGLTSLNWASLSVTVTAAGIGISGATLINGTSASTLVATANQAAADATAANAAIASITSDNVLSPPEKTTIITEHATITGEYAGILALADARGITTERTAYVTAYNALIAYLATLTSPVPWNDTSGNTSIVGSTFRTNWATLYTTRQALLNRVAASAIGGRNVLRNAAFTVDTNTDGVADFWAAHQTGSPGTVVRSLSTTGGPDNGRNMRAEALALPASGSDVGWSTGNHPIALPSAGGPVRFSAFVLHTNSTVTLYLEFKNAAGAIIGVAQNNWASPGPTWRRLSMGATAPAGTTQVFAYVWINGGSGSYSALFLAQPQIEPGEVDTAFSPRADELLPGVVTTPILADGAATIVASLTTGGLPITRGRVNFYLFFDSLLFTPETTAPVVVTAVLQGSMSAGLDTDFGNRFGIVVALASNTVLDSGSWSIPNSGDATELINTGRPSNGANTRQAVTLETTWTPPAAGVQYRIGVFGIQTIVGQTHTLNSLSFKLEHIKK